MAMASAALAAPDTAFAQSPETATRVTSQSTNEAKATTDGGFSKDRLARMHEIPRNRRLGAVAGARGRRHLLIP